jgi:hypothetical protein
VVILGTLLYKKSKQLQVERKKHFLPSTEKTIEEKILATPDLYKREKPIPLQYLEEEPDTVLIQQLALLYNKNARQFSKEKDNTQHRRALSWSAKDFVEEVSIHLTHLYNRSPLLQKFLQKVARVYDNYDTHHWSISLGSGNAEVAPDDLYAGRFKKMSWFTTLHCQTDVLKSHLPPKLWISTSNLGCTMINGDIEQDCDVWLTPYHLPQPERGKMLDMLFNLQKADTAIPYLFSLEPFQKELVYMKKRYKPHMLGEYFDVPLNGKIAELLEMIGNEATV